MGLARSSLGAQAGASGHLGLTLIRGGDDATSVEVPTFSGPAPFPSLGELRRSFLPSRGLSAEVNEYRIRNLGNLARRYRKVAIAKAFDITTPIGALYLKVIRGDGEEVDLGLTSLGVVTTAGVTAIASHLNNGGATISGFKFHGFGIGTTAEASGDTALVTELTTEYAVDSTRPTGSQAASTNTYTTIATLSPDSGGTLAITEHGIFTAASAGTLLDRSKFSAVNLVASADSLQATYVLTLAAGG